MSLVSGVDIEVLFAALAAELRRLDAGPIEICVIGGSALAAAGFVERPTKDIDVVAVREGPGEDVALRKARPLPAMLDAAVIAVAEQFAIDRTWLNPGPTDLLDHGLPDGFEERWISADYGNILAVHFAGRIDQICFKTYAAADSAGRHLTDLIALAPTLVEMEFAASWVTTQDDSEGFGSQLTELIDYLEERRADGAL